MKKKTITIISAVVLSIFLCLPALAQTTTNVAELQKQIDTLRAQIETLKAQLETLKKAQEQVDRTQSEITDTLKLIRQLRVGMTGEDVKMLQEILSTDKDIYPEGLITGYYGRLTEKAVKKFQQKAGIEQAGNVGPKTLSKINEILKEGAGNSGKVPPGLLIAPGIQKKLGGITLQPLPGQILPPGIEKKLETTTPSVDGVNPL